MSNLSGFATISSTQRFREVGSYSYKQLLHDLRDLNSEVQALRGGFGSGALKGEPGSAGPRGVKGDDGIGTQGAKGKTGSAGLNGLSVYELAVILDGFQGTEEEYLASIQGSNTLANDPDDWGFIDTDYGLVTQPVTGLTVDYGA